MTYQVTDFPSGSHVFKRVTKDGELVTILPDMGSAESFLTLIQRLGITTRKEWKALAPRKAQVTYINASRAGGDLSLYPFTK